MGSGDPSTIRLPSFSDIESRFPGSTAYAIPRRNDAICKSELAGDRPFWIVNPAQHRNTPLCDRFVNAGEQPGRDGETKRFGGIEIDHKPENRWLLDGEIGGLCSPRIKSTELAALSVEIPVANVVGRQSSFLATALRSPAPSRQAGWRRAPRSRRAGSARSRRGGAGCAAWHA